MTPDQAMTGLVALVGGGGVSGIIAAIFGYLTAARQGRDPQETPTISLHDGAGPWDEAATTALTSISTHLCRIAAILEIEADERWNGKDFRDLVSDRMLRIMVGEVKASAGRPP